MFSIVAASFYMATAGTQGFQIPVTFWLVFFSLFGSHPNGCEVVSHCGFDLHFSND